MTATIEAEKATDIEFDIDIDIMPTSADDSVPMLTSISLCTGGCTSAGGGSMCSWCC